MAAISATVCAVCDLSSIKSENTQTDERKRTDVKRLTPLARALFAGFVGGGDVVVAMTTGALPGDNAGLCSVDGDDERIAVVGGVELDAVDDDWLLLLALLFARCTAIGDDAIDDDDDDGTTGVVVLAVDDDVAVGVF